MTAARTAWVTASCAAVASDGLSGTGLYDCSGAAAG